MNTRPLSPRSFRFALWLALFAALAQFALGLQSAHHQARMLAAGSDWQEICTVDGIVRLASDTGRANDEESSLSTNAGSCVLCAASSLAGTPPATHPVAHLQSTGDTATFPLAAAPRLVARFAPRPPGQGPPLQS